MKTKILFAVIFALCAHITEAQRFGIKSGLNFANVSITDGGMSVSPKSLTGFHIGPIADFNLKDRLYLNAGLLYSLKGTKIDEGEFSETVKVNYLEIPLNLAYKFSLTEKSDFFIQAGPYLAYGLSGKADFEGESIDLFSAEGGLKRFDFGIGFGAGVEIGSIVGSLNYQLGLANLLEQQSSDFIGLTDMKMKNKV